MLSLDEIQKLTKQIVKGQDDIVDKMSIFIYKYLLRAHGRDHGVFFNNPLISLLCGPSGNGKTFLVKTLAEISGLKFYEINCKSLSQEGWVGTSFVEFLYNLKYNNTGIIFLDEFDKLTEHISSTNSDDVGKQLQTGLLKYFDGFTAVNYKIPLKHMDVFIPELKFNNCVFILSGAFTSLYEKLNKKQIGFTASNTVNNTSENTIIPSQADLLKMFIEVGLIPEIAGRVSEFHLFHTLTYEKYEELCNSDTFIVNKYNVLLKILGIPFILNKDMVIKQAINTGLGARGLVQAIEQQLTDTLLLHQDKFNISTLLGLSLDDGTAEPYDRIKEALKYINKGNI